MIPPPTPADGQLPEGQPCVEEDAAAAADEAMYVGKDLLNEMDPPWTPNGAGTETAEAPSPRKQYGGARGEREAHRARDQDGHSGVDRRSNATTRSKIRKLETAFRERS